jgi:hypothetical protein
MVDDRHQDFRIGGKDVLQDIIKIQEQDAQRRQVDDQEAEARTEFF